MLPVLVACVGERLGENDVGYAWRVSGRNQSVVGLKAAASAPGSGVVRGGSCGRGDVGGGFRGVPCPWVGKEARVCNTKIDEGNRAAVQGVALVYVDREY